MSNNKSYEKWLDEYLHQKNIKKMKNNLANQNNPNISKQDKRNEYLKELIIKSCRQYLNENKIIFREEQSDSSFSYYFHIDKSIMEWQHPVIRISDHISKNGKYRLAEFIVNEIGVHSPDQQVKKKVWRELDKGFKKQKKSALHKAFEQISNQKDS